MARGFNNIQLLGTLTSTPELKYTGTGLAILELNLAGKEADGAAKVPLTWYQRATVFRASAEFFADKLTQGDIVFVDGRLNYRSYDDKNTGDKRSSVDVTANRVERLVAQGRSEEDITKDSRDQPRLSNAINRVTLIGNLTRDAELKYTPNGNAVNRFSLAVNEQYQAKGEDREKVAFIDISCWESLAVYFSDLSKGDAVMVSGVLSNDSWTDNNGNKRYSTRVEARELNKIELESGKVTAPPPQQKQPSSLDLPF